MVGWKVSKPENPASSGFVRDSNANLHPSEPRKPVQAQPCNQRATVHTSREFTYLILRGTPELDT